jgi:hypothetical protein
LRQDQQQDGGRDEPCDKGKPIYIRHEPVHLPNTNASHPCWDERRILPWFHPFDGAAYAATLAL